MAATRRKQLSLLILLLVSSSQLCCCSYDYASALTQSLLYFEASRSGLLPSNNRVLWRSNSALRDGKSEGVDLLGGYYVNGDNGKYGLPMAFAITMLSWSVLEFGTKMDAAGELSHALYAIKWGTDYFIKCHTAPNVFYAQVGEEWSEHDCWERPEDMDTSRKAYKIDQSHPGSDLAAETAAALAAASIAFRATNPPYSSQLLNHAKLLFEFATKYQGRYQDGIPEITHVYQSYECEDEQIWAAVWLYDATSDTKYIDYINQAYTTSDILHPFNWDNKYPGIYVLVDKLWLKGKFQNVPKFRTLEKFGENFICNCLGGGPNDLSKTNGGLIYWKQSSVNNLESVTCASFLVAVHAEALLSSGLTLDCFNHTTYTPTDLMKFVRSQVDYILGSNPNKMSYMVGFGPRYPQQVYHKAASIVSIKLNKTKVGCQEGWELWEKRNSPNPNVLEGAIVGGPADQNDYFSDIRYIRSQTEPTLTTAAPFVGLLASLS